VLAKYSTITAVSSGFGVTKPMYHPSLKEIQIYSSDITIFKKPETTLNGSPQLHFPLNSFQFIPNSTGLLINFNNGKLPS
jgi:hypothetical protein